MARLIDLLEQLRNGTKTSMYWIAEPAYVHQGEYDYLLRLIDALADKGADAVKFHIMLNPDEYMVPEHPLYKELQKWLFTREQWRELFARCRKHGMEIVGLADELPSLEFLIEENAEAIAIHATSINDTYMLKGLAQARQPLFVGIGGISFPEIEYMLKLLGDKRNLMMMYGIQEYPTPLEHVHLQKLPLYEAKFQCPVGYADHTASREELGRYLAFATAYGLGARLFEQHVTLDLSVKREDDEAALEPDAFAELRGQLELVSRMTGSAVMNIGTEERAYFSAVRKCLVAGQDLPQGTLLTEQHVKYKRTQTQGDMDQRDIVHLLGKTLQQPVRKGDAFCWRHLGENGRP
ncbi:hypothetical protein QJ48_01825 [Paenibacillus sp. A3]|uniref:N-acetylneuraminate synthase family protein n=1 Tax=Paenibacillus sp. A3 TaxID=1337054 RepID=UPI0006D554DD|nr:N-acetylneuraminate synthase family protein [Paenibacillus sp. A3]KPV61092.1 hypothetical protein QJ48_01825 [Paenibacillus sp. A3]